MTHWRSLTQWRSPSNLSVTSRPCRCLRHHHPITPFPPAHPQCVLPVLVEAQAVSVEDGMVGVPPSRRRLAGGNKMKKRCQRLITCASSWACRVTSLNVCIQKDGRMLAHFLSAQLKFVLSLQGSLHGLELRLSALKAGFISNVMFEK